MLTLTLAVVLWQLMGYQMLFYLEIWPNIPSDFHNPLFLELLVNQERCKDLVRFPTFIRLPARNTAVGHCVYNQFPTLSNYARQDGSGVNVVHSYWPSFH